MPGAVVITGASTGIGATTALRLETLGFTVFAGVRRPSDGEALRRASERLRPLALDVTEPTSIAGAAKTVGDALGGQGLAGLVNNAGIVVAGPLEFLPLAELRRQLEVNVVGQLAVTQAFLPLLRTARGRIVNIGSISGRVAKPFTGPYAASKFALEGLTDALRMELRPWGIAVSLIEPGAVATPIWEKSKAAGEALAAALPSQAWELYGSAITTLQNAADKIAKSASAPEAVADAVVHALTAPRPKTRYVVGRDAKLQARLATLIPDRWRDGLIIRAMGLCPEQRSTSRAH